MNRFARPDNFGHKVRNPLLREHFVYRVYDKAGRLIYIGCSRRPEKRLKEHKFDSPRWHSQMASVRLSGPYNYETARQLEYDAINSENSVYNETSIVRIRLKRRRDEIADTELRAALARGESVEEALAWADTAVAARLSIEASA